MKRGTKKPKKRNGSEVVRLDGEVIEYLKKNALPFESRNDVARRLLGLRPKPQQSQA